VIRLTKCLLILLGVLLLGQPIAAREWNTGAGSYRIKGTLVAFDDQQIVIKLDDGRKLNGHELVAIQRKDLAESDQEYLESDEAVQAKSGQEAQTWTMRNGISVIGRVVDFAKRDIAVQRRRGKVYVNDKMYGNLPEIYQRILLRVVEHFENVTLENSRDLDKWIMPLKGEPRTYSVEGVILELNNGDEYGVPFFLFSESDLAALQPHWEKWLAANDASAQQQHSLYLQSEAQAYQQGLQDKLETQNQLAIAQLQFLAVATGAVDLWEVYLRPGPGVVGYPMTVVVTALNSQIAIAQAMQQNPGYIAGPVRKASR
jgi:hypothetical protein